MLNFYGSKTNGPISVEANAASVPAGVDWIDALEPTPDDMSFLERTMGVRMPTEADLVEIESSSRLAVEGKVLIMSLPMFVKDDGGYPHATPVGFVLDEGRLVTIRFKKLATFEGLARKMCGKGALSEGGYGAVTSILEIIVENLADLLEHVGTELDTMSHAIFSEAIVAGRQRPKHANRSLMHALRMIGRAGDLISKVSQSLLGLSRMIPFLASKGEPHLVGNLKTRLETIGLDAKSLHEFQEHLASKTQFLLDTLLGLTNIEQNNVFRVLTVVSVIGIPPTFFASMYGMNFKTMPEYDWAHGYAYGLTLIVLSAVLPATWFKVKGWW